MGRRKEQIDPTGLAMALPDFLPDQVDRNALVVALAILAGSVIGTLVPPASQAAVAEVFCKAVCESIRTGRTH